MTHNGIDLAITTHDAATFVIPNRDVYLSLCSCGWQSLMFGRPLLADLEGDRHNGVTA